MQAAEQQKTFINPHTGDRLIIVKDTLSTKGSLLGMEAIYKQTKEFAPEHYHPFQEERFEVLSGTLRTKINGKVRDFQAGEVFVIPVGTPHGMHNAHEEPVHFSWEIRPALRSEAMFTRLYESLHTNKLDKKGRPSLKVTLSILSDFQREFRLTAIPLFLQKIIFGVIGILYKQK
ncbi:cupin domain-containing protein [Rhodocytophaga rosea]|uniref:Cupin domain-containing protein n=1 Tax=Rhodocytophaga rosea TaxID=2704465 RepID=A0A6C0GFJ7_9BACT|nr:cupin domain-containing protein [Rhodocytophaga rosea]QHT66460.1 cupin domain-containing protein [Rhodocytophaga rosea]